MVQGQGQVLEVVRGVRNLGYQDWRLVGLCCRECSCCFSYKVGSGAPGRHLTYFDYGQVSPEKAIYSAPVWRQVKPSDSRVQRHLATLCSGCSVLPKILNFMSRNGPSSQ